MGEQNGYRWWHSVAIFVVVNLASALPAGFGGDFGFYNSFRQPSVAPPDWVFAPVWLFLNSTSLIALHRVANLANPSTGRTLFLWSEGIGWVLFAAFTTLYFLLRSPVLGAVDTAMGLAAGAVSLACAARLDRPATAYILMRVLWLALATYVSVYIALHNPDPFLGTPAAW